MTKSKLSQSLVCITATLLFSMPATAQMNRGIPPFSFVNSEFPLHSTPTLVLPALDVNSITAEDRNEQKNGHAPKFARNIVADIDPLHTGSWTLLPNGDRVWKLEIVSDGALALIPYFDEFQLPEGATLHLYAPEKDEVLGAFTAANNPSSHHYGVGLIHGGDFTIEYYEPKGSSAKLPFHIHEVGYAYRMVPPKHRSTPEFGTSDACQVNVNCPEGGSWQDQKNAVVRILITIKGAEYWCSGALVNNVRKDCTPYLLSADHCYEDDVTPGKVTDSLDLSKWVFYFNYESPTCANPANDDTLTNKIVTGAKFKACSLDFGGDQGSDFLLLQLNPVPTNYHAYFAGWSTIDTTSAAGVSIHHPFGDIKKISSYNTPLVSTSWGGNVSDTHWEVSWATTATSRGVTEEGSSGSPIFNADKRIIGTLTGGNSFCNNTDPDDYGKFAYHWVSNGASANRRLKNWLDPDNTGAKFIDGKYATCGTTSIPVLKENKNSLSVYPNPSAGVFTIKTDDTEHEIVITDVTGRLVVHFKNDSAQNSIDLSHENDGIYFVSIRNSHETIVKRIVLVR